MGLADIAAWRGIEEVTLEMCGVYTVEDDDYEVRFPYRNLHGVWYDRKGLGPEQPTKGRGKILSPPNSEPHLYNPLTIGPNATLTFICEGEYDTLSVIDCGYDAVGSQGTSTFKAVWGRLFAGGTTVIAFDGDSSGRNAAVTLRKIMSSYGASVFIMDIDDEDDMNDMHRRGELADYLANWLEEQGIDHE